MAKAHRLFYSKWEKHSLFYATRIEMGRCSFQTSKANENIQLDVTIRSEITYSIMRTQRKRTGTWHTFIHITQHIVSLWLVLYFMRLCIHKNDSIYTAMTAMAAMAGEKETETSMKLVHDSIPNERNILKNITCIIQTSDSDRSTHITCSQFPLYVRFK